MTKGSKEKLDSAEEKPTLEYLRDYIKRASKRTEREFTTTQNTWMGCFLTNIFVIETQMYTDSDELQKALGEKYQTVKDRLKSIKQRSLELREQYPSREVSPSDDIKRELWNELNNIFE